VWDSKNSCCCVNQNKMVASIKACCFAWQRLGKTFFVKPTRNMSETEQKQKQRKRQQKQQSSRANSSSRKAAAKQ